MGVGGGVKKGTLFVLWTAKAREEVEMMADGRRGAHLLLMRVKKRGMFRLKLTREEYAQIIDGLGAKGLGLGKLLRRGGSLSCDNAADHTEKSIKKE